MYDEISKQNWFPYYISKRFHYFFFYSSSLNKLFWLLTEKSIIDFIACRRHDAWDGNGYF